MTAATIATSAFSADTADAQYVDLYELSAYCNAGYYDACAMLNAYAMQMQAPAYDPYAAHADRMERTHNWGQQMLANGAANSAILDQRHNQFMETLRN